MRNDPDWRVVFSPETAPVRIRMEYARAVYRQGLFDRAGDYVTAQPTFSTVPDWSRLMFQVFASVGTGHALMEVQPELEWQQTRLLAAALGRPASTPEELTTFVNLTPDETSAPSKLVAISDAAWGRFCQRHLLNAYAGIYYHYDEMWGVPERAAQLRREGTQALGGFAAFPLLECRWTRGQELHDARMRAWEYARTHPEWLPEGFVRFILGKPDADAFIAKWFTTPEPTGTTYNDFHRECLPGYEEHLEEAYRLAPTKPALPMRLAKRLGKKASLDQYLQIVGPLIDYNYRVAADAAKLSDDPAVLRIYLEKSAKLDPGEYFVLGRRLAEAHLDDEAAVAYQKGVDLAPDRVEVSNSCEWLVNYYYDHGQKDKALQLATSAAEVGSSMGLGTMSRLQERMGNLAEAERYGEALLERYSGAEVLAMLYLHHPEMPGAKTFPQRLRDKEQEMFSGGLKRVTLQSFSGPPLTGLRFHLNERLTSLGFDEKTLIVALDGVQVETLKQYFYVRAMTASPKMTFILWKNGHYEELHVEQPNRRFDVPMEAWTSEQ